MSDLAGKVCRICLTYKLFTEFYKHKTGKHGFSSRCKSCLCQDQKDYHKEHPRQKRATWIRREYGISLATQDQLLLEQNNRCAICKEFFIDYPQIDHCHITKKIRGMLCRNCNVGIAMFKDDTDRLTNAIDYLRKNG